MDFESRSHRVVESLNPESLNISPMYAHAVRISAGARLIHTAGQIAVDENGKTPAAYVDQIKLCLKNLDACLKSAGATTQDIVKLTYFIVDYDPTNRPHIELLTDFLRGHRPATTLVPVPALASPKLLFEIEAVAAISEQPGSSFQTSESTTADTDVIVIGAGLSGLQAAYDLQKKGVSCLVLEARDRVGGKTWSISCAGGKGVAELGGAWFNDVNQPRVAGLAKALGLESIEQNTSGYCMMEGIGTFAYGDVPNLPAKDQESFIKFRDTAEELCQAVDPQQPEASIPKFKGQTFHDLAIALGATEVVQKLANLWTSAMLGKSSKDVSALYFLMYCKAGGGLLQMRSDRKGGGQHLRLRKGTQSLSWGLAAALQPGSVLLSHPVKQVIQMTSGSCTVVTTNGRKFTCSKVIVSIPTPLYKEISFSPQLGDDKQLLITHTSLGFYAKVTVIYKEPWWRKYGLCGLSQTLQGPVALTRDTSSDADGVYALTCFIVGDEGKVWSQLSAPERQVSVLKAVDSIYGKSCPAPIQYLEQDWMSEQYSQGAPCPVIADVAMDALSRDQWRPEGNLHFIGTETSPIWKGYMEGALTSGARGANEVLAVVKPSKDPRAKL